MSRDTVLHSETRAVEMRNRLPGYAALGSHARLLREGAGSTRFSPSAILLEPLCCPSHPHAPSPGVAKEVLSGSAAPLSTSSFCLSRHQEGSRGFPGGHERSHNGKGGPLTKPLILVPFCDHTP